MKIKVKKLHEDAKLPTYGTPLSSGADLYSVESGEIKPFETKVFKLGFAVQPEEFCDMQVRSRSGLAAKHGVHVLNAPGTVDSDFRGEMMVILHNTHSSNTFQVNKGDRIGQLVVHPQLCPEFEWTDELDDSVRGVGGFGSTGR